MHFHWEYKVKDNDTWLNIGKGAWTWDPAPGANSSITLTFVITDLLPARKFTSRIPCPFPPRWWSGGGNIPAGSLFQPLSG